MPPSFPLSFFSSSSSLFLPVLLLTTALGVGADKTQWDVAVSAPVRESRFLDVPVYYGNWVPIGNAKATLERVAASIEAAQRQDVHHVPPVFVDSVKERVDVEPQQPQQPQQQWRPQRLPIRPQKQKSVEQAQQHQLNAWRQTTNRRPYRLVQNIP